jgi:hypothetical protein
VTSPHDLDHADLAASRYGRTPARARRTRVTVIATAIAFVAVFGAWLWWGGLLEPPAQFETKEIAHEILDDRSVSVTWRFSAEPGTSASCAVQALNSTFGVVGWRVVELPPSESRTREFTEVVLTSEEAVTGLIYRCWLT